MHDIRYGLRVLWRAPSFTLIAIMTLAVGIGASTAVFGVINATLLRPLPYRSPDRILMLWRRVPPSMNVGYSEVPWNRADFLGFAHSARTLDAVAAFKADSFNLTGPSQPVQLTGLRATSGFFRALGVDPAIGRTYTAEEDQPGGPAVVILSDALWRTQFAADPAIVGHAIDLNGVAHQVIGVMPAGFEFPRAEEMPGSFTFPRQIQVWVPAAMNPGPVIPAETSDYAVVGRMKTSATIADVRDDLGAHELAMTAVFPAAAGWFHTDPVPLADQVASSTKRPLLFLFGAVMLVLLIACSNVANLLLARSMAREREFTLRAALGASRRRIVRQVLTESIILSALAAAAGLGLAQWVIRFAIAYGPRGIPRLHEATLDFRVFAFALAAACVTAILFGIAPACAAAGHNVGEALKRAGGRTIGASSSHLRRILLGAEIAVALVLVVSSALMTRTFYRMVSVNPGFQPERVLTFELALPAVKYPDAASAARFYTHVRSRLAALPGVDAVGIVETIPMAGATDATGLRFPGRPTAGGKNRGFANYTVASPGYLRAAGTPLLRGRDFLESDDAGAPPVTIINSAMARKFWPNEDPIGQKVGPSSLKYPEATVIGIAADVKHLSLRDEPQPEMYVPYTQKVYPSLLVMNAVVRSRVDPSSLAAACRAAVQSVDRDLPIAKVETLTGIVDDSLAAQRFTMLLLAAFGALSLALASVGLYGLVAFAVGQRTQEIGIRMALGASQREIFELIFREGTRSALPGVAAGLALAIIVSRLLARFLYGVHPYDPLTFAVVSLVLIAVVCVASALPARRATRLDPLVALRSE
jgi:putative ABC transport system permease protein